MKLIKHTQRPEMKDQDFKTNQNTDVQNNFKKYLQKDKS